MSKGIFNKNKCAKNNTKIVCKSHLSFELFNMSELRVIPSASQIRGRGNMFLVRGAQFPE